MHRSTIVAALLVTASLALAQHVPPGPLPNVGPPLLLRLDGTIEESKEAARAKGFDVVSLGFLKGDERRWLAVTDVRTVGGDQPLFGKDVLAIVAPFDPNLLVAGADDLVRKVRDAPPGTALRIEGLVSRGSRVYQLRSVEPLPEKR